MRSCNQLESNQLWKLDCYYCMQLRDTVLHRCVRVLNASLPAAMLADDSAAEFTSRTLMIFHHLSRSHYLSTLTVVNYQHHDVDSQPLLSSSFTAFTLSKSPCALKASPHCEIPSIIITRDAIGSWYIQCSSYAFVFLRQHSHRSTYSYFIICYLVLHQPSRQLLCRVPPPLRAAAATSCNSTCVTA